MPQIQGKRVCLECLVIYHRNPRNLAEECFFWLCYIRCHLFSKQSNSGYSNHISYKREAATHFIFELRRGISVFTRLTIVVLIAAGKIRSPPILPFNLITDGAPLLKQSREGSRKNSKGGAVITKIHFSEKMNCSKNLDYNFWHFAVLKRKMLDC